MRPTAWEYHLEQAGEMDADRLAALGQEGWELAAIDPGSGRAIFKRPAPDFSERITLAQRERVAIEQGEQEEAR